MSFLESNLNTLFNLYPQFAQLIKDAPEKNIVLSLAKLEGTHLLVEEKPFNSKINPIKEAVRIAEKQDFSNHDLIILGGVELGYILKNVFEKYPNHPILVVEKRASILKAAFKTQDFIPFFLSGRVQFLIPENAAVVFEFLKNYQSKTIALIFHRPSFDLDPDFYRELKETVEKFISTQEINKATLARFEKLWFKNLLLNLSTYLYYQGVEVLFKAWKDRPVFLIGAGPSLQKQIPLLKKVQNQYLLIAVNTSLPYLLEKGITPHFVVTVDPQDKVYRYFLPLIQKKPQKVPILIAEPTICPKIVKNYPGPILFCQVGFLQSWVGQFAPLKGELDMGGSVITAAFSLARQMGAKPIVFLGTDMAYTKKTLHFRGAELEKEWLYSQTKIHSLEQQNYDFLKKTKLFSYPGFYDKPVYTDMRFLTYINWLEKNFRLFPELLVINATEGGIAFKHIQKKSLKAVIEKTPPDTAIQIHNQNFKSPFFEQSYTQFVDSLKEIEKELPPLKELAKKGVKVCQKLVAQAKNKREPSLALLQELDKIDKKLSTFSLTQVLSLSLQKVIQEVNDGIDAQNKEKNLHNNQKTDPLQTFTYSLNLYQGILESARFNQTQIQKAFIYSKYLLDKK